MQAMCTCLVPVCKLYAPRLSRYPLSKFIVIELHRERVGAED